MLFQDLEVHTIYFLKMVLQCNELGVVCAAESGHGNKSGLRVKCG